MGLRPGEKLHEDMLAETELPFTYKVDGINLASTLAPIVSSFALSVASINSINN